MLLSKCVGSLSLFPDFSNRLRPDFLSVDLWDFFQI